MLKSLNQILDRITNQPEWEGIQRLSYLIKSWSEIVGMNIANHTRPYAISRDILYVATSSSVWAQELKFKRRMLLKRLNASWSEPLVDIHFSPAQWRKTQVLGNGYSQSELTPNHRHPSTILPMSSSLVSEELEYTENRESCEATDTTTDTNTDTTTDTTLANRLGYANRPEAAFKHWAKMMQMRSQNLPLCPQCQCPTPPGELQRWDVCGLCAIKQWQI
ncbi:hypothetical protein BJP34_10915 [Moorena producens PAL-8-15-08-1]|uniref:RNA-binding protein n=1 Tax=Moorena producens PAL-8-15-08-1 TaxID=1458985 RepID=A0A1D8TR39_9CYAN|nr:DciA family protein [Moorena producens]AOW99895.1 hypothetical protein BJP34_10915 [Moorena producens PAL-8-15-08-1]